MFVQQEQEIRIGQRRGIDGGHLEIFIVLLAVILLHPALLGVLLQGDGVAVGLEFHLLHLVVLDQLDQLAEFDLHLAGCGRGGGEVVEQHHDDDGPDDDGRNAHHTLFRPAALAVLVVVIAFMVQEFFLLWLLKLVFLI